MRLGIPRFPRAVLVGGLWEKNLFCDVVVKYMYLGDRTTCGLHRSARNSVGSGTAPVRPPRARAAQSLLNHHWGPSENTRTKALSTWGSAVTFNVFSPQFVNYAEHAFAALCDLCYM